MQYGEVKAGRFIARPNRFIAHIEIDGKVFFMAKEQLLIGDFADVQINDILEYDLLGEQV